MAAILSDDPKITQRARDVLSHWNSSHAEAIKALGCSASTFSLLLRDKWHTAGAKLLCQRLRNWILDKDDKLTLELWRTLQLPNSSLEDVAMQLHVEVDNLISTARSDSPRDDALLSALTSFKWGPAALDSFINMRLDSCPISIRLLLEPALTKWVRVNHGALRAADEARAEAAAQREKEARRAERQRKRAQPDTTRGHSDRSDDEESKESQSGARKKRSAAVCA